jgi:hypothetical protein
LKSKLPNTIILGNNTAKWGIGAAAFGRVVLKNIYPGIDAELKGDEQNGLKLNYLSPAEPIHRRLYQYHGIQPTSIGKGALEFNAGFRTLWEHPPVAAWPTEKENGVLPQLKYAVTQATCRFAWQGKLPQTAWIIDPTISFSSYSGSTSDNSSHRLPTTTADAPTEAARFTAMVTPLYRRFSTDLHGNCPGKRLQWRFSARYGHYEAFGRWQIASSHVCWRHPQWTATQHGG